jgi:hypothetical protein
MNKKRVIGAALAGALLFVPYIAESSAVLADGFYVNQTNAERADITNWVANSSEQISTNIQSQHINVNDLNGSRYVIQWGDTLSGISQATGIPMRKLAYDNHIRNIDLIYAGDILILNRNGSYVPSDWNYEGHGTHVANTKVTINNFVDNSDNSVTIVDSPITVNNTTNNNSTTNNSSTNNETNEKTTTTINNSDYESPVDPVATTTAGSDSSAASSDTTAAAEKDADSINATTDSQTTTSDSNANKTSASTTTSSKSGLEDSDFADEVSSKLADQLGVDTSKVSVDFGGDSSSAASADSESSDVDAEATDTDSQTVYDDDQSISIASDKLSAKNAAKVAKKIYKQLESDDKLSDVTDADSIDVTLSATDGGYDFNISLSSESSDDSDSNSSSESDTASDTNSSSVTTSSDDTTDAEDY